MRHVKISWTLLEIREAGIKSRAAVQTLVFCVPVCSILFEYNCFATKCFFFNFYV